MVKVTNVKFWSGITRCSNIRITDAFHHTFLKVFVECIMVRSYVDPIQSILKTFLNYNRADTFTTFIASQSSPLLTFLNFLQTMALRRPVDIERAGIFGIGLRCSFYRDITSLLVCLNEVKMSFPNVLSFLQIANRKI